MKEGMAVTPETMIRRLPPGVVRQLGHLLDPHDGWKPLAENIHREDGSDRFDQSMIDFIEHRGNRNGSKGPTMILLEAWGTDNTKVQVLLDALIQIRNYRVADYLQVDIMKGDPVKQPRGPARVATEHEDPLIRCPSPPIEEPSRVKKPIPKPRTKLSPAIVAEPIGNYSGGAPSVHPWDPPDKPPVTKVEDIIISVTGEGYLFKNEELRSITDDFNIAPISEGGRLLGSGGFGEVFKGHVLDHDGEPIDVAVKRMFLQQRDLDKTDILTSFMTELKVLSRFKHENLLPFIGYSDEHEYICIVYTYMPNGSLQDRLACQHGTVALDIPTRVSIAVGTARGLCHLHNYEGRPMIHKDVKSANILLDENMIPKLGDFGQCRQGPRGLNTTVMVTARPILTPVYAPPEMHRNLQASDISSKGDTYAYGVVLLEIVSGLPPVDDTLDGNDGPTDIISRREDFDGELCDWVDKKAGNWPSDLVKYFFDMSEVCRKRKKQRPTMTTIMPQIEEMMVLCSEDSLQIGLISDSKT